MSVSVAILGAGLQGTLCALELADRGARVVLFDRRDKALTEASLNNEGKIHLGYIFAKDDLDRSADLMVHGALCFGQVLGRWISGSDLARAASVPFTYLVMRDSLLSPAELAQRYRAIDDRIAASMPRPGASYLGADRHRPVRQLDKRHWQGRFDDRLVAAAFETAERSVHLPGMAVALRAALADHPRIETRFGTPIAAVQRPPDGRLRIDIGSVPDGPFDHVVNALWGDRLRIDATLGITTDRPFLMRRKVANYVTCAQPPGDLPSVTMVLGPYGDIVTYPDGSHYLSWYPDGCIGRWSSANLPVSWSQDLPEAEAARIFDRSVRALDRLVPGVAARAAQADRTQHRPGVIFAWGRSDVDDPDSELHQRHDVGPRSYWGDYHSVDTGKLSLAPLFALQTADRILPP